MLAVLSLAYSPSLHVTMTCSACMCQFSLSSHLRTPSLTLSHLSQRLSLQSHQQRVYKGPHPCSRSALNENALHRLIGSNTCPQLVALFGKE
jgi:hypothetical protein